jgi:exodeoxyribonuclease V alpha subunit
MEKLIAARIAQLANVSMTSELEKILIDLVKSAKEGHLCHRVTDASLVPNGGPLVLQGERLYLQRNWALETEILHKITERLARNASDSSDRFIEELAKVQGLQEAQYRALLEASKKMFVIFNGGPGTGKTFTAGCFIRTLAASRGNPLKVAIAAPTGKAAAHLESSLKAQGL